MPAPPATLKAGSPRPDGRNGRSVRFAPPEESLAEEEIERRPLERNAAGVADGAVGGVLDRAVGLDVADGAVAAVLDGSVRLDVTDGAVAAVLDGAVRLQVADGAVRCVLDRAVRFDVADGAIAAVLDGSV